MKNWTETSHFHFQVQTSYFTKNPSFFIHIYIGYLDISPG